MSVETDLVFMLQNALGVFASVFFGEADKDAQLPHVVFELESRDDDHPKGSTGLVYSSFEVICSGATYVQAMECERLIRKHMAEYRGQGPTRQFSLIRFVNAYDDEETDASSYLRFLTMQVNHYEV